MFLPYILAFLLGFLNPTQVTNRASGTNNGLVSASSENSNDITGGDAGHIPPRKP